MPHASKVHIRGFRSFADTGPIDLTDGVNLLLGANGAGKSNFIGFFRFLNRLCEQQLYRHTGEIGGAASCLHRGAAAGNEIFAHLEVGDGGRDNAYEFTLRRADDDRFIFTHEQAVWLYNHHLVPLAAAGASESALKKSHAPTAIWTYKYLSGIRVFHFHDTSSDAPVMGSAHKDNSSGLAGDARNLAPILLHWRETDAAVYEHIRETIRLIAPFFDDFVLVPDKAGNVSLRWRQEGLSEDTFGPSAFSDGTLRFICLTALLNQPDEHLPKLVLIDEPELGLHPHAIHLLAEMLKSTGARTQLVVATQSPFLVDHFAPENVLVVQRQGDASVLERKTTQELSVWLEDYTLGELWRKNLLGGTPL